MNTKILAALQAGTADIDTLEKTSYRARLGAAVAEVGATITRETGCEPIVKEVLTLTDFAVTVANTTGASFGGAKFYDFPEGNYLVYGAVANLSVNWAGTDIGATGSGDFSIGTTATADATINSTDASVIPSSALTDPFVAGVGRGVGVSTGVLFVPGHTTAGDLYLNMIIDDADVADAASDIVLVSGTITLFYVKLGDFTAV